MGRSDGFGYKSLTLPSINIYSTSVLAENPLDVMISAVVLLCSNLFDPIHSFILDYPP